jgi:photosystem II stability/assembly factor-like uncharacterized protein
MQRRLFRFSFFWMFPLVSGFALANPLSQEKTNVQSVHAGFKHEAIYGLCVDDSKAIAVGEAGLILSSTDSGNTWIELERFSEVALLDVECGRGIELYVGQSGEVYRRTDGSLQAVSTGSDARLMSVAHSQAAGLTVAVGAFGTILVSTDAGRSWTSSIVDWFAVLDDYVDPHLYDVDISELGVVTIVGEFSLVLQSVDQGQSWTTRQRGEPSLFGLNINGSGVGYAVGQEGTLLSTSDAGTSWTPIQTPSTDILLNVTSMDDGLIIATGMRQLIFSVDGGDHWNLNKNPAFLQGWYQGLEVSSESEIGAPMILLAGHRANILKLELQ